MQEEVHSTMCKSMHFKQSLVETRLKDTMLSTYHHLSLEKVNLELQLVSCLWKECLSLNPSVGSLTCLIAGDFYNLYLFTAPQPWETRSLKYLKDIEPF